MGRKAREGSTPSIRTTCAQVGNFGRPLMFRTSDAVGSTPILGTICEHGGTGRRAGFRFQCLRTWGFDSPCSHHMRADRGLVILKTVIFTDVQVRILPGLPMSPVAELVDATEGKPFPTLSSLLSYF